jgi:hypothetical protein
MSDITRAEFDALVQKVDEIHWMLKSRQPFVVPSASTSEQPTVKFGNPQPDPWPFMTFPPKTTGGTQ